MPTGGSYEFKLAKKSKDGFIEDAYDLERGEWGWIDRTQEFQDAGVTEKVRWLMIYACCPDCGEPMTLYRKRGSGEPAGHNIDPQGNISPSVLHSWIVKGVEQCGFHTQPTKLLGFIERRS
jgi:hypothetical protein